MNTISDYLGTDHTRCDAFFAQLELAVTEGEWDDAGSDFKNFERAMARHFRKEEELLFVAFEKTTGNSAGPTSVMRIEHQHLRAIMSRMCEAVVQHDADEFFGHADTLRIMMHQHNMKEESILYLMSDRVLAERRDEIVDAMKEIDATDQVGIVIHTE